MRSKRIATGLLCLCLLTLAACSTPLPPPRLQLPASLTVPCPLPDGLPQTNGELLRAYVSTLDALAECSARHKALVEAVK